MESRKSSKVLNIFIGVSILAAFALPAWHYVIAKDYYFIVETPCDPSTEVCNYRDCSDEEDCPLGELEYFERNQILASDFETCTDNTCEAECEIGAIHCVLIPCDENSDYECTVTADFEESHESVESLNESATSSMERDAQ